MLHVPFVVLATMGTAGTNVLGSAAWQNSSTFQPATANGTILSGVSFTIGKTGTLNYHVTFTTTTTMDISTYNDVGAAADSVFSFIGAGSN